MKKQIHEYRKLGRHMPFGVAIFFFILSLNFTVSAYGNSLSATFRIVAEDIMVRGTVVDNSGMPIPGATVSVEGTTTGTATDIEGRYTLSVPEGSTLVFSFIGFVTQRIPLENQSEKNVTLLEDM